MVEYGDGSPYQHVTDAIRQDVAKQVDELIWQADGAVADADTVPVNRSSLAALLRLAEFGLTHSDSTVAADARAALDHIRTILGAAGRAELGHRPDFPEQRNEPTFEPTGLAQRSAETIAADYLQVSLAEDKRFELLRGCPQHAFQACALGH